MIDDQLTPEEQNLVQQLQAVSKPRLDAGVRDTIRERMVSELRVLNMPQPLPPRSIRPRFSIQLAAALVAAVTIVVIISLVVFQSGNQNTDEVAQVPTLATSSIAPITVVPSVTLTPTVESEMATAALTPVPSAVIEVTPTILPTTTLPPSSTQEVIVVIEGPVTSMTDNTLTVYDISIELEPQHPVFQVIEVGDIVRVQGSLGSGGEVVASVVSNIPDTNLVNGSSVTVGLDGPVEAINGNIITVNGIPVQLSPDNPLLQTVQLGDFVSVQGNFENNGTIVVLVVVNIIVINNVIVDGNPYCWFHAMGMGGGHWHCDGMGMGMGMGMGDDGMGMGG